MKINVKFYLDADKRIANTEKSIYCFIRSGTKLHRINTGKKINPKKWDAAKQRAKGGEAILNQYLQNLKNSIDSIVNDIIAEKKQYSFNEVVAIIKKHLNPQDSNGFFDVFDEFLEMLSALRSPRYLRNYKTIRMHFVEFSKKNKIVFEEINEVFWDKLQIFYAKRNLSINSMRKTLDYVKTFFKWTLDRGKHQNYNINRFKMPKPQPIKHIALTKDDLQKFVTCVVGERLDRVRDFWLFMFFTGQGYNEVARFNSADVDNDGIWFVRRSKTGELFELPLPEKAKEILRKYDNILPVLSNQKTNEYLKEIGKIAGIDEEITIVDGRTERKVKKWELLTCHTARRTFNSRLSFVARHVRNRYTGHDYAMESLYYQQDGSEVLDVLNNAYDNIFSN